MASVYAPSIFALTRKFPNGFWTIVLKEGE